MSRPCVQAVTQANSCTPSAALQVKLAARRAAICSCVSSPPLVTREVSNTMSEPVPKLPEMGPEPAVDSWHVAFDEFKERDMKMVKDYQEEIDTLLVVVRGSHCLFARALNR
jgi:hypothetical protein